VFSIFWGEITNGGCGNCTNYGGWDGQWRVAVRWNDRAEGFVRELTAARMVERWMGLNNPIALSGLGLKFLLSIS